MILVVVSLVTGRNFLGIAVQPASQVARQTSAPAGGRNAPDGRAGEDRSAQLVSFVLDDAQRTWTRIFAKEGKQYRHAKLVLYRGATYSGCGTARSQTGPFYCPVDEKVYIDLDFWDELRRLGGDSADFAQAYVIAHELGHHVQKLLGIEGRAQRLTQQDPRERNAVSVAVELQADCFAGVWGHSTEQRRIVSSSDVGDALKAAAAVGDDHIARTQGRAANPDNFTHGTSAQRERWFQEGLKEGTIEGCTTFAGKIEP